METATIGWVVDAQVDFMRPDGRLYVRDPGDEADVGAARIIGRLTEAVQWMSRHCDVVVYTGDWHALEDEEIDPVAPDPTRGTYPPHCMGRSDDPEERAGAAIVEEIRPENPVVLEIDATAARAEQVAETAVRERRPIFIHKTRFDVFAGNPATDPLLEALARFLGRKLELVVVGVARDVCVTQAVDGLQARGLPVTALSDVTWGLGLEPEAGTLARWARHGRVTTLEALVGERVA